MSFSELPLVLAKGVTLGSTLGGGVVEISTFEQIKPMLLALHLPVPTYSFTTFTCTLYSVFCPYSEKDDIPTKLFTWLMKVNIPLIFPFTCSSAKYDFFQSLPLAADLLDRANTAFLFRSFNQLLEKVGIAMIPNALYTFTKNASKTRIIPQCPTCLNQKMLDSEKGLIRNIQQECAVFT